MLAGDQLGQVFLLLRRRAVAADLIDAEIGMRAVGKADRGRGAADLLHRHAMGEIAHRGAAEFLLDGDTVQAKFAHLRPQLTRKFVGAIDLGRERRDLVRRKVAHAVAQLIDIGAEIEIERGILVAQHGSILLHPAPDPSTRACGPAQGEVNIAIPPSS